MLSNQLWNADATRTHQERPANFMKGASVMVGTPASRTRRVAFKFCVVKSALFYAFFLGGLSGLLGSNPSAWDAPIHRVHHVGVALFIGIIVVGLLAQLRVPERNVAAFHQVVAGVLAIQITNLIMGNPDNHGGNVGIMDPAFLVFLVPVVVLAALHPVRGRLFSVGASMSRALAGIALVDAVPLAMYGVDQAIVQRNSWPPLADPHHQKWFMMAFLAFAISLVGLVASLRNGGWPVPAWSAGVAAVVFGLVAVLYPGLASSVGRIWGSASILGGAAFIGAAVWEAGRDRAALAFPQPLRNAQESNRP